MCGFCGFTGTLDNSNVTISSMMDKIVHRGPDSNGIFSDDYATLGFVRLSILDLEEGSQPMYNEDDSVVIVFNGEIYNHKPLREMLIEKGHVFKNHSDTEVIIHLYEEYGTNIVEHLRGMFAIAIYDINQKRLFIFRDHFGIKPLYYTSVAGNLAFGSEIKAILEYPNVKKRVNEKALSYYLGFQYNPLEETFFKDIYKLMPGHMLEYDLIEKKLIEVKRYFNPLFTESEATEQKCVDDLEKVLLESINLHSTSADVEVGSFLSSGVDSSFVSSQFCGTKTFTVGFDNEKYSEVDFAAKTSEIIEKEHFSHIISKEEYFEAVPKVQYHMDEPLADPSCIGLYFVSKIASEKVKVAMSGEGADEFFGGYNIYKEVIDLKPITILPEFVRKGILNVVNKMPSFKGKNYIIRGCTPVEERFIGNAKIFSNDEKINLLKNPIYRDDYNTITKPYYDEINAETDNNILKMQYIDTKLWLVGDILLKADKMSMANSLEVRVPLLDKEVFKVARSIPSKYRVSKKGTKLVFRKIANKYLPSHVSDKKKLGFPIPIREWLKDEDVYDKIKETFTNDVANKYFDEKIILDLLYDHKKGVCDNSRKIWCVYAFLVWHNEYFTESI